jgi:predicted ArsR family transcriptional regulator
VGLHPNSVRWHLGILRNAGIVASRPETRSTPGRPRILYRVEAGEPPEQRDGYRLLATVLADTMSHMRDGSATCEAAGRAWGADLVASHGGAASDPVGEVLGILGDQGFEPERDDLTITMHRCPFHDLAEASPEIVCAVHRGLIAGALRELGSGLGVSVLEIFPRPNVCIARLAPLRAPGPDGERKL